MIANLPTHHKPAAALSTQAHSELVTPTRVLRNNLALLHANHGFQYHQALRLLIHAITKDETQ